MALDGNPIGNHGVAALAAPLRTLPALETLNLIKCEIGDDGVASLFADLGKDDFRALTKPALARNGITNVGMATLEASVGAGRLPALRTDNNGTTWLELFLPHNPASPSAVQAVVDALAKRPRREAPPSWRP